jgi:DNA helicase HerA-like ATPase
MAGETGIFLGAAGDLRQELVLRRANRHGLIAGATGTGKTVTLQVLAEGFSAAGVPVFVSDVKGDLSGLGMAGSPTAKTHEIFAGRAREIGDAAWRYDALPVQLWDLFGEQGHPIRATISEMGPLLLARLLDLNETQEGVLNVAFHVADEDGLLLLDLDDLQAMLSHCAERASELSTKFGNITRASVGTIQRQLLQLRTQGAENFFGEPALDISEFIRTDENGRGVVNILAADKLMASPRLYGSFLLWMLSELFEILPEIGDPDRPVLVFFFDEAHLLFDDAPKALLDKIEQVVRLIRSKGVGVYFVTQNPIDIPEDVAGQLGNRVQHALRAFTPKDAKAVRSAAETFRPNPDVDVAQAITELKVGEALVSVLQEDGSPSPVQRALIRAPGTRVGPLAPDERAVLITTDAVADKYDTPIDRESAEEILAAKADEAVAAAAEAQAEDAEARTYAAREKERARIAKEAERTRLATQRAQATSPWGKMAESAGRAAASSVGRQVANEVGREIFGGRGRRSTSLGAQLVRGVLGGLFRG